VILVGLTAVVTGTGGVFANLVYGEGFMAAIGIGISLSTLTLGLIITYMGLSDRWRE
jgi:hypothetical protein